MSTNPLNLESAKSGLTVALGVYPIFVGLYAVGFFWDVPKDALGGFSFGDFILKASIIYASFSAFIIAYFLAASSALLLLEPKLSTTETKKDIEDDRAWDIYARSDKIRHVSASVGILLLGASAFWIDTPAISLDPAMFIGGLFFLFTGGIITRPFVTARQWRAASILFILSCIIIAPIYAGFSDAQVDANSPLVKVGTNKCSLILLGSESAVMRCQSGYALITKDKFPDAFYWKDRRR